MAASTAEQADGLAMRNWTESSPETRGAFMLRRLSAGEPDRTANQSATA